MSFFDAGMPALSLRDNEPQPSASRAALINAFVALQMLGLLGSIALILTTTLSHRAPRNATWQNFFTSWIVWTVSYSLLLFSGQLHKDNPRFGVCLAQAGLIYGIPSLSAATTFGLIAQIWFNVQTLLMHKFKYERVGTIVILVLPYIMLFSMVVASWVTGTNHPASVKLIASGMYCHIGVSKTLGRASAALVALTLLPTLVLEILICIALRRNWSTFKRMKHSMSITLRVVIFTLIGILAISLSAIFVFSNNRAVGINLVFAAMPVISVVVFASQKDIISVWMFWRPRPGKTLADSQSTSTASSVSV